MKHCPACAAPNPQTRATCYACRHALDAAAPGAATATRPPQHAAPAACPNCGSREVERGRPDACAGCGRLLNVAATTNASSAAAHRPIVATSSVGLPPGFEPDQFAPLGAAQGVSDDGLPANKEAAAAGPPPGWSMEPIENVGLRLHRLGGLFGRVGGKNKNGAAAGLLGAWVLLDALAGLGGPLLMGQAAGATGGVSLLEVSPGRLVVPRPGIGFGGGKPRIYTLGTTLVLDVYEPAMGAGRGPLMGPVAGRGAAVRRRLVAESVGGVTTLDETVPTVWGMPGDASALNALAQFLSAQTGFPLRDRTESSRCWL